MKHSSAIFIVDRSVVDQSVVDRSIDELSTCFGIPAGDVALAYEHDDVTKRHWTSAAREACEDETDTRPLLIIRSSSSMTASLNAGVLKALMPAVRDEGDAGTTNDRGALVLGHAVTLRQSVAYARMSWYPCHPTGAWPVTSLRVGTALCNTRVEGVLCDRASLRRFFSSQVQSQAQAQSQAHSQSQAQLNTKTLVEMFGSDNVALAAPMLVRQGAGKQLACAFDSSTSPVHAWLKWCALAYDLLAVDYALSWIKGNSTLLAAVFTGSCITAWLLLAYAASRFKENLARSLYLDPRQQVSHRFILGKVLQCMADILALPGEPE